ncbi:MAG: NAD(P)/FAD-dependent oxidoreductase [bacterium]|nr:NAD(P)/FAD-dependent oxidoreductase [bacterium]
MRRAAIIGAGPAGLTAALELLERTDVVPVVFEASDALGGLSRTVVHAGNRIDIGGHRFFSKSDRVMDWWLRILPQQGTPAPDPATTDAVMLVRSRLSRIFYLRRFFDYPVTLSLQTVRNLGLPRMLRIGFGYARARLFPVRPERSLEDFFINRFGRQLYATFFRDYTEKVWGVPCRQIRPEWGAQRIKGLSITGALLHAARGIFGRDGSVRQKGVETSLIERFLYPKFGPGQMWEEVARRVVARGGEIRHGCRCVGMDVADGRVTAVRIEDAASGRTTAHAADYVISTMPVQELVAGLGGDVPAGVREVAAGLRYRDFITVGLLLDKLLIRNQTSRPTSGGLIPDNWIYIQEPDVRLGRLQVFNNWSPYLVADPTKAWLGLEYFCNEGDDLWSMDDAAFADFAVAELAQIGVIDPADVRDRVVIRMPKTYPAYFGTYDRFREIRDYTDTLANLFLIGRNGMHRYNNQDHSMLTAMAAVDAIASGATDKTAIWDVNVEGEYHEEKRS